MAQRRLYIDTQQPLAFGSFRNWLKLLWQNRGVDRVYVHRALFVSLCSLLTSPFRLYQRTWYGRRIKKLTIQEPPIFIIGHWRSGTTHLFYLMCQDKNLGYVSTFQTLAPELFIAGKMLKPIVSRMVPTTRVMDNMSISVDSPQEEEFGVVEMSPYSFYHHWSFPRQARNYFDRYVLFHDAPPTTVARWKDTYLSVLKKAAWKTGQRRLIVKNPVNTARIKLLLELFPDAKFIYVYRNPYVVLPSTLYFYRKTLEITQLQTIGQDEIEANVLYFYSQLLQRFLAEKHLIPPQNLVQVRFEDLEADPLAELCRIYQHLQLPGFAAAEGDFCAYIASQANYQKNYYALNEGVIEKVNRHWRFAVDCWGYAPPTA